MRDEGSDFIRPAKVRMSGGEMEGGSSLWIGCCSRGFFDTKVF